jgi:3-phosphoshikimate 1-carboxyvinyltransferase
MRSVRPGPVEGALAAPPSKSVLQRAVALATLTEGRSVLAARTLCDDVLASLRVAGALGASVEIGDTDVAIRGGGPPTGEPLDCGEAGLSMRMFAAVAGLAHRELTLTARGGLATRPVQMALGPLTQLGARCAAEGGRPPLTIRGPIHGGMVTVDGSTSSQFLTGLLIALPRCERDSVVRVEGLRSVPYVRLTVALARQFGAVITHDEALETFVVPGRQSYTPQNLAVEGDWSGASFPLVAGAVAGDVTVGGLDLESPQADRAVLDALAAAGAEVHTSRDGVRVSRRSLEGFEFDATHCPDLFPPLVALAAACRGTTRLRGAHRLRHKESDRAAALVTQFGRIGGRVRHEGDELVVEGAPLAGGEADACGDHRIAMALALGALTATAPVEVVGHECVCKSYPAFFEDLAALQGRALTGSRPPAR